jgi:hypothetical protein
MQYLFDDGHVDFSILRMKPASDRKGSSTNDTFFELYSNVDGSVEGTPVRNETQCSACPKLYGTFRQLPDICRKLTGKLRGVLV